MAEVVMSEQGELRKLVVKWRNLITNPRYGAGVIQQVRLEMCATQLEEILDDHEPDSDSHPIPH